MRPHRPVLILLFISVLVGGCASDYRIKEGRMVFSEMTENGRINHEIREPISASFTQLSDRNYAKDSEHVFWQGLAIPGAQPQSFRCLGDFFSKDKTHVYWRDRIIEGADPSTFQILDGENLWSKDGRDVYFADRHLGVQDVGNFGLIKDGWGKDSGAFYYAASFHPRIGIVRCQYESMVILDEYYAKDAQRVFYQGEEVSGADPSSFHVTGPWTGADKHRTYKFGVPKNASKPTTANSGG